MDPNNDCFIYYETQSSKKGKPCRPFDSERFMQPRMSLLGKRVTFSRAPGARHDMRHQKLQSRIYNFLERPRGRFSAYYHMSVFMMVFLCLVLSILSTIKEFEEPATMLLFKMEICIVVWFAVEYVIRLWSSGCRSRYQGYTGRLKFMKRPFCVIDLFTILASIVVLSVGASGQGFATSALRGLRFFQILRMLRMDRRGGTWKLLRSVVYAHRQELLTSIYIGFLGLVFTSFMVYMMEKDVNEQFTNYAQSMWWGVITLATIGYGDLYPITWQGKLCAAVGALLGVSFFALPAGILGSGFALKVQEQQRQKHMIRRHQPAATLIQAVWRCYAADEDSMSVVTWKAHIQQLRRVPSRANTTSNSFRNNSIFVSLRRSNKNSLEMMPHQAQQNMKHLASVQRQNEKDFKSKPSRSHDDTMLSAPFLMQQPNNNAILSEIVTEQRPMNLTVKQKNAIRFIRKLKYFVARRKFKEALRPYDVKDVMEQYAAGHADLLGRVKNIHTRLDHIFGAQGHKSKDIFGAKISFASRVIKIEAKVVDMNDKLDNFIKLYMNDRERFTQQLALKAEGEDEGPEAASDQAEEKNQSSA